MRTNFTVQAKDDAEKGFWGTLVKKLGVEITMNKIASQNPKPLCAKQIVKEGMVITPKGNGEYVIKLGNKADIVIKTSEEQEKSITQDFTKLFTYLGSIDPELGKEYNKMKFERTANMVYKDLNQCRDCVWFESDTSHETYRDKCKHCSHATLGGNTDHFFPRSGQMSMYCPKWKEEERDVKKAFLGSLSLLDAHVKGQVNEVNPKIVASEIIIKSGLFQKDTIESLRKQLDEIAEKSKKKYGPHIVHIPDPEYDKVLKKIMELEDKNKVNASSLGTALLKHCMEMFRSKKSSLDKQSGTDEKDMGTGFILKPGVIEAENGYQFAFNEYEEEFVKLGLVPGDKVSFTMNTESGHLTITKISSLTKQTKVPEWKMPNASSLGTALLKHCQDNHINFQKHGMSIINELEKQSGITIHYVNGDNVILAAKTPNFTKVPGYPTECQIKELEDYEKVKDNYKKLDKDVMIPKASVRTANPVQLMGISGSLDKHAQPYFYAITSTDQTTMQQIQELPKIVPEIAITHDADANEMILSVPTPDLAGKLEAWLTKNNIGYERDENRTASLNKKSEYQDTLCLAELN